MSPIEKKGLTEVKNRLDKFSCYKVEQRVKERITGIGLDESAIRVILSIVKSEIVDESQYVDESLSWINTLLGEKE